MLIFGYYILVIFVLKTMTKSSSSQFISLSLKTAGLILVLSSLLDYITLGIGVDVTNPESLIGFVSQLVDRGIVPMVGMALIFVASWIDSNSGLAKESGFNLKLPVLVLSLILGFVFLVSVPIHLNNLRLVSQTAFSQLDDRVRAADNRISDQYEQLEEISQDPQRLQVLNRRINEIDTAIDSGQLQGQNLNPQQLQRLQQTKQQLEEFRELAQNPEALEARLNQLQTQLKSQEKERKDRARTEIVKQGVRTGLSSLMLAIGYLFMGWLGLKSTN